MEVNIFPYINKFCYKIHNLLFFANTPKKGGLLMANEDTIKLLEKCNSGVQMAVFSMEEILEDVKDSDFRKILIDSISAHRKLGDETHSYLSKCGCEAKDPNPVAKGMSWMKTNTKILFDDSDKNCADLITEGCNMGIKTLYRYLNEYKNAEDKAKNLAETIIREEESLRQNIRCYL